MGLCSGEASLVMASTASWSATPGTGSHRCISDGLFVKDQIERMVWIGVCGKVNNLSYADIIKDLQEASVDC